MCKQLIMSEYSKQINDMIWSYSRVLEYTNCPYSFYLKYIINDEDLYLPEGNYYAEVGSFVHKILEMVFKGELDIDDALDYYLANYDDNVFYTVRQSIMDSTYIQCAEYFANEKLEWLNGYDVIGVEQEISIDVGDYKFTGYIDLILQDKETGEITIVDHKSSKYPFKKDGKTVLKNSKASFEKYKLQMYLYSKYIFDTFGRYPKYLAWNHFKSQKIAKIEFKQDEYEIALQWFIWQIVNINNDESFEANIDHFYCRNLCDFRSTCEYFNQDD